MSVLDCLPLRFRSLGMAREEDTVVIIESLKPVTHLYSGAREDALKGRKGGLPRTGLDPGDDGLRYTRSLGQLALSQVGTRPSEPHQVGSDDTLGGPVHGSMIPEAVSVQNRARQGLFRMDFTSPFDLAERGELEMLTTL